MRKKKTNLGTKYAQTFVEYTLLLGVMISLLIAMTPMVRRAGEGMVKVVSDHVGVQANAEAIGGDYGHLESAHTYTDIESSKNIKERLGTTQYGYDDDTTFTSSTMIMNQGYTPTEYSEPGY